MTDITFEYEEIAYIKKIFGMLYTQLFLTVPQDKLTDEALDELADFEERLIAMIRERACN